MDFNIKNWILLFVLCCSSISLMVAQNPLERQPINPNKTLQKITFGSCNNQAKPQDYWAPILQNRSDLWIWLGDIIYADTKDMNLMASKYAKLKNAPSYQLLRSKCPIIGIWDDHDFGANDACKTYPKKSESKELLFNFLDIPATSPARVRAGAYQTYTFGPKGKKTRVILLDTRYFRDEIEAAPIGSGKKYLPNPTGTILGEAQWKWLERTLTESDADVHLIVSSIQVLPTQHIYEKWENFPNERKRLISMIERICPKNPILLSGDRHMAEISSQKIAGYDAPLIEITSSGLTHTRSKNKEEVNDGRIGQTVIDRHFGVLEIDWDQQPIRFKTEIRGLDNNVLETFTWTY